MYPHSLITEPQVPLYQNKPAMRSFQSKNAHLPDVLTHYMTIYILQWLSNTQINKIYLVFFPQPGKIYED